VKTREKPPQRDRVRVIVADDDEHPLGVVSLELRDKR